MKYRRASGSRSFFRSIWLSIFSLATAVILLGGGCVLLYANHALNEQISAQQSSLLHQYDMALEYQLSTARQSVNSILRNPYIKQMIYLGTDAPFNVFYHAGLSVTELMSNNLLFNSIYVISGRDTAIKTSRLYLGAEDDQLMEEMMYAGAQMNMVPWTSTLGEKTCHHLAVLSPLDMLTLPNDEGGVVINLDLDKLFSAVYAPGQDALLYLVMDGQIVMASNSACIGLALSECRLLDGAADGAIVSGDGVRYYVTTRNNASSGYTLYLLNPSFALFTPIYSAALLIVLACVLLLVIFLMISWRTASHVYQPVKSIIVQMQTQLPQGDDAATEGLSELQLLSRTIRYTSEVVNAYQQDSNIAMLRNFIVNDARLTPDAEAAISRMLHLQQGHDVCLMLFHATSETEDAHIAAEVMHNYLSGFADMLMIQSDDGNLIAVLTVRHDGPVEEETLIHGMTESLRSLPLPDRHAVLCLFAVSGTDHTQLHQTYVQLKNRLPSAAFCPASMVLGPHTEDSLPAACFEPVIRAARSRSNEAYSEALRSALPGCLTVRPEIAYHELTMLALNIEGAVHNQPDGIRDSLKEYQRLHQLLLDQPDYYHLLSVFIQLYQSGMQNVADRGDASEMIVSFISEHYMDPSLSAQNVADALSISSSHLSRVLRKSVNCAFPDLLLRLRMSHALQVLQAQPDLAIADLARQCGFNSASYFASSFKRYYGVTPSSYRLRRLSGDDDGCEAPSPASESL